MKPQPEHQDNPYPRQSARITFRMSGNELERIDDFADSTGRDRSNIIRAAVKKYLDRQPPTEKETKKQPTG